jgi:hypothetical protein
MARKGLVVGEAVGSIASVRALASFLGVTAATRGLSNTIGNTFRSVSFGSDSFWGSATIGALSLA